MEERFTNKIQVSENGCWNWTGSLDEKGYGRFKVGLKPERAHRYAWIHENGPIPVGLVLDHLCRNRACCNPEHLEAVTQKVNIQRGMTGKYLRKVA